MRRSVGVLTFLMLVGCAGSRKATVPLQDPELARDARRGRAAFEDGTTARATDFYRKALNRAVAMDDAAAIGTAAYNLALCQIILGQLDQARATLAEAQSAFQRSGSNPADVLLLEATIAQRQGRWEEALSLADQVLSASSDESHHFQARLLQAAVAYRQGDLTRAKAALPGVGPRQITEATLLAARERLVGDILSQEGHPVEAAAAFDRAAALFQKAKHYRDMALTLQRAGQAYRQTSDTARAEDRLQRAQRSLAAQGQQTP